MTIRVFVLIAAIACLGLAMCAYTDRAKPNPPTAPQAQPDAQPQAKPQQPPPEELEEGKMGKQKPRYLPATKAPGSFE